MKSTSKMRIFVASKISITDEHLRVGTTLTASGVCSHNHPFTAEAADGAQPGTQSTLWATRPMITMNSLSIFAYSESKLTCHFVVVVVVVLVVLLGGKRSEKVGKRSKKVASS